jgi:hypothetical protein
VNPTTCLREPWAYIPSEKAEQPKYNKNYYDCPQHEISPFYNLLGAVWSPAQTALVLFLTLLNTNIDARRQTVFFCEHKKPKQPPDQAPDFLPLGQHKTRLVSIRFVFISRNVHSVTYLSISVLIRAQGLKYYSVFLPFLRMILLSKN